MTLLLDTHVFLWWLMKPEQIHQTAHKVIEDPNNSVFISTVSLWEIAIKRSIGKLRDPIDLVNDISMVGFSRLDIQPVHIAGIEDLPWHHRDPFDRLLIAQARFEDAVLISRDGHFQKYDVNILKA